MKSDDQRDENLSKSELDDAHRRTAPSAAVVYEAIRREGEEELDRNTLALMWSGIAAGLSMGFSFLTEALINYHLPNASWQPMISKLGYCVGFIIVVLGRQQLFTENTLTAVIPFLNSKDIKILSKVAKLWTTVLAANLVGAFIFAMLLVALGHFESDVAVELSRIAAKGFQGGFGSTFLSGIFAGWLIALMVWLLPGAETARVAIIVIITYVVGLGGFPHIIAGSIASFYSLIEGDASLGMFFSRFFLPALTGNTLGGVAFVTAINHAQVDLDTGSK